MELIDRRKLVSDFWQGVEDASILSFEDTDELMEKSPTVDAVEVVRCKYCRHWIERTADGVDSFHVCWFTGSITGRNHFCSYGERKDNG